VLSLSDKIFRATGVKPHPNPSYPLIRFQLLSEYVLKQEYKPNMFQNSSFSFEKSEKLPNAGASPSVPPAEGGLCPQTPSLRLLVLRLQTPLASGYWGLRPQAIIVVISFLHDEFLVCA